MATGQVVAGFEEWMTNFGVTMTFPIFLTSIGLAAAYSLYAAFALICTGFVVYVSNKQKAAS